MKGELYLTREKSASSTRLGGKLQNDQTESDTRPKSLAQAAYISVFSKLVFNEKAFT